MIDRDVKRCLGQMMKGVQVVELPPGIGEVLALGDLVGRQHGHG